MTDASVTWDEANGPPPLCFWDKVATPACAEQIAQWKQKLAAWEHQMRIDDWAREHSHNYQGAMTMAHGDCLLALPAQPSTDNPAWFHWIEQYDSCEVQAQQEHDHTVRLEFGAGLALGVLVVAALLYCGIKRWHQQRAAWVLPMMKILRICSPLTALSCVLLYRWLKDRDILGFALPHPHWNGVQFENAVDWTAWLAIAAVILLGTIAVMPWAPRIWNVVVRGWNAWLALAGFGPPSKLPERVVEADGEQARAVEIAKSSIQRPNKMMKVLRIIGMTLMVLWMFNGAGHAILGPTLYLTRSPVFEVVGGIVQFGIAFWLFRIIYKRHKRAETQL